jgi:hypothetical protein
MLGRNEWLSMALGLCLGFVLCGTIVSMNLDWPSQSPPRRFQHIERYGHTKNEKSAADLNEAKPPLAVQIVKTERDEEQERREEERAEEHAAVEDGMLSWTRALVVITAALALFTMMLYLSTRRIALDAKDTGDKAIAASTKATDTLVSTERPYVTAGGDIQKMPDGSIFRDAAGKTYFRLEVGNYGKTPAILTAFDVRFGTLAKVQTPPNDVAPSTPHNDLLAPGERHKPIRHIEINKGSQVVYGAFWYQSPLRGQERDSDYISCFVLKLGVQGTEINVPGADDSYRKRD